ncbi:MAG: hypothetical protein ACRDTP_00545, partial [Mycobacteriales bacterium]
MRTEKAGATKGTVRVLHAGRWRAAAIGLAAVAVAATGGAAVASRPASPPLAPLAASAPLARPAPVKAPMRIVSPSQNAPGAAGPAPVLGRHRDHVAG